MNLASKNTLYKGEKMSKRLKHINIAIYIIPMFFFVFSLYKIDIVYIAILNFIQLIIISFMILINYCLTNIGKMNNLERNLDYLMYTLNKYSEGERKIPLDEIDKETDFIYWETLIKDKSSKFYETFPRSENIVMYVCMLSHIITDILLLQNGMFFLLCSTHLVLDFFGEQLIKKYYKILMTKVEEKRR